MRIEPAADPLAAVANDAVALDVAADAGVQVSHRFEGVVARAAWGVAPFALRRVEASGLAHARCATHRDAEALVAERQAEEMER